MMRRLRSEQGSSMVELSVVVVLLAIVGTMIMTSLVSTVRASSAVQDQNASHQDLRTALEIVERDLRAANPIDAIAPSLSVSQYATSLSFSVYCASAGIGDCNTSHLRKVTYRVTGNRLERVLTTGTAVLIGPSGPAGVALDHQRDAVVNTASRPPFRYFDRYGHEVATTGASAPPSTHFRDCVRHVEIYLLVNTTGGPTPTTADLTTTGTLRNFNEVNGC